MSHRHWHGGRSWVRESWHVSWRAIRPGSRRRSRSLHNATMGLWATGDRILHSIGIGVGMASLRGQGCAAGVDQSDERARRLPGVKRRTGMTGSSTRAASVQASGIICRCPFSPSTTRSTPSPRRRRTTRTNRPSHGWCGHPVPLDVSGIARRSVLVDVLLVTSAAP